MYVISLLKNGDSIAYSSHTTGIIRPVIRQCWHYYLQGGTAQVFYTNCAYTTGFKQQVLETKWQNGLSFYRKASLLYNVLPHNGFSAS